MGNGYVRQSSADIVQGNIVNAGPINNEFNALRDAFDGNLGHSHDGTVGEGPLINLTNAVTGVLPVFNGGTGVTDLEDLPVPTSVQEELDTLADALEAVDEDISSLETSTQANATAISTHSARVDNPHSVTAAQVGLGNVNNTSDANKPVSTATQIALNSKANTTAIPQIVKDMAAILPLTTSAVPMDQAINFSRTLTASSTFDAPTGAFEGASGTFFITQDSTGGRTASWNTFWDFGVDGPPTIRTDPNETDYVFYVVLPGATKALCSYKAGS